MTFIPLLALSACDQEPEGQPVLRTEIGSGVADEDARQTALPESNSEESPGANPAEVESQAAQPVGKPACRNVVFEQIPLTHCIADPAQHRISTKLSDSDGKPYRSLAQLSAARGSEAKPVVFAVNGGMFDKTGKPIGYYVENARRTQKLNRNKGPGNFHLMPNGVFFGTGGKWQIKTSDNFFNTVGDRPAFGTQSGPMLVIKGKLHPEIADNGPSKVIRNGVGVAADGRAHFVISNAPLSFGVLARFYRDRLKVPNALFLDGNVSALWDPAADRLDRGPALGPLIVVENRE